ncbi:hypothetical protein [Aurantiacibacter odishensis]|uniref:hypothetical protein n=1 Tax=Aurantiacibacter odishensis TaxID=1155476 RepID=UPI000E765671|nr:hypothetical protein [Aurantiacibacter odishensis]
MNFSLIPMSAAEELALDYAPSASSNRLPAVLYPVALFFVFQLSADGRSADVPSDTAGMALFAEASCEDCIPTPIPTRQTKD